MRNKYSLFRIPHSSFRILFLPFPLKFSIISISIDRVTKRVTLAGDDLKERKHWYDINASQGWALRQRGHRDQTD